MPIMEKNRKRPLTRRFNEIFLDHFPFLFMEAALDHTWLGHTAHVARAYNHPLL